MVFFILSIVFISLSGLCVLANLALGTINFIKKIIKKAVLNVIGFLFALAGVILCALYLRGYYFPVAIVGSSLGLAAVILTLVAVSKIKEKKEEDRKPRAVSKEDQLTEAYFYVEFSQGAIRLDGNVITIYRNWLPFTFFKFGRVAKVFYLNDIQMIDFKGSGWFLGIFRFYFKHFNRPASIAFGKWFVWRRFKLNRRIKPLYEYLLYRVTENNETNKS